MSKYYILEQGRKTGPFSFQELKSMNIQPTTYIWTSGMKDWTEAKEIEDLSELLQELPPPIPPMPSSYLWASILGSVFCCLPLGIVGIIYSTKVSDEYNRGNYEKSEEYSEKALFFSLLSVSIFIIFLLLSFTIWLLIFFSRYGYMNKLLCFI